MGYYEEDFYYEPTEFDIQMEQIKENLMKSVKEEFLTELEQLKSENKELQSVKQNFEEIKRDFEFKKNELERERIELERKIRNERLVDLSKDHRSVLYRAVSRRKRPPKCEKCDYNRNIKYTTPLGREAWEACLCSEGELDYYPQEVVRYEFRISRYGKGLTAWYRQYGDDEDGFVMDDSILAENIYSPEMKFEDINRYRTFFKSEEDCQAYCDHLNKTVSA